MRNWFYILQLNTFSNSDALHFPVVNKSNHLLGVVTVGSIKESFVHQENVPWALAHDMMLPVADVCYESTSLDQTLTQMKSCNQDCLCVVEETDQTWLGVLDTRKVHRKVNAELLRRQDAADEQDRDMA